MAKFTVTSGYVIKSSAILLAGLFVMSLSLLRISFTGFHKSFPILFLPTGSASGFFYCLLKYNSDCKTIGVMIHKKDVPEFVIGGTSYLLLCSPYVM